MRMARGKDVSGFAGGFIAGSRMTGVSVRKAAQLARVSVWTGARWHPHLDLWKMCSIVKIWWLGWLCSCVFTCTIVSKMQINTKLFWLITFILLWNISVVRGGVSFIMIMQSANLTSIKHFWEIMDWCVGQRCPPSSSKQRERSLWKRDVAESIQRCTEDVLVACGGPTSVTCLTKWKRFFKTPRNQRPTTILHHHMYPMVKWVFKNSFVTWSACFTKCLHAEAAYTQYSIKSESLKLYSTTGRSTLQILYWR